MRVRGIGLAVALSLFAACGDDVAGNGSYPQRPAASVGGRGAASLIAGPSGARGSAAAGSWGRGRVCTTEGAGVRCFRADPAARPPASQFAGDRLIVKFKDRLREPADVVQELGGRFAEACASDGKALDALNAKYRVGRVVPVFGPLFAGAPVSKGREALEARRRLLAEMVTRSRASFPARSLRAPAGAAATDLANVYSFEVPPGTDLRRMARDYAANENVAYAVPDNVATVDAPTDDPFLALAGSWGQPYFDLWGLHRIGAPAAWDTSTGLGVVVAVVDTGLDFNHPDIAANVWVNEAEVGGLPGVDDDGNGFVDDLRGWSFATRDADVMDRSGHGTHVAGTVAAVGDNALGVVGVAHGARIMAVKALSDFGTGYSSDLASAIIYAARNGADVISNSWGCFGGEVGCGSALTADALAFARSMGCVVTFAAGNDSADVRYQFPTNEADAIAVASTTPDDSRSYFSNTGYAIDVAAPGSGTFGDYGGILSLRAAGTGSASEVVGDLYIRKDGTSMATPHVSGVAALLLSANPALTVGEVEAIIKHTAADEVGDPAFDTPGRDVYFGWGRLDAAAAVARAFDPPPDPPICKLLADPSLDFVLPQSTCGGTRSLLLEIYNLGGGTLDWSTSGPGWLTVTPPAGSNNSVSISASVDAPADQAGTLTLTSLGGDPVALTVSEQVISGVRVVGCDAAISRAYGPQMWGAIYSNFNDNPPGVADGAGGAVYAWTDGRTVQQIFAQRVDSLGNALWTLDGVALSPADAYARSPAIAADGAGGAIVAWAESPTYSEQDGHIRVQRVDASGQKLWGEGLWLSEGLFGEVAPTIMSDGAGGAVVAWEAFDPSGSYSERDIYAQRIDSSGLARWTAGGAPVTRAPGTDWHVEVATDEAGGAFLAWDALSRGVFAQHLGPEGDALWGPNGIELAPEGVGANVVPDGSGGAIVAWTEFLDWVFNDLYATRVDAAGNALWGAGGVPVVQGRSSAAGAFYPGLQVFTVPLAGDGDGGAFVAWMDHRNDRWDIYAQKLGTDGSRRWGANGVPVAREGRGKVSPRVVPDGNEGAIFTWIDFRSGEGDVFVQRLDGSGAPLLGTNGLWLDSKAGGLSGPLGDLWEGDQGLPFLVPVGNNRVLVTWEDYTLETDIDYVGKVIEFASDVVVSPGSAIVEPGGLAAFTASGGSGGGWRWSLAANGSGGTIDPATGAYAAGSVGNATDVVQVKDSFGNVASVSVSVVAEMVLSPETATVAPRGGVDFTASGGSGTGWEWSLAANPSGGTIDPGTGAYTAGSTGGVIDVVEVRDSWGITESREVTVTAGVSVAPGNATLPPRQTLNLRASGGSSAGFIWSLATAASGGEIDEATGAYRAGPTGNVVDVVRVTDSLGNTASATITLTAGVSITPAASTAAPGATLPLLVEGGSGEGYSWSLATDSSGGSMVSYGGTIGDYRAGRLGDVTDVVEVTDSLGNTARVEIAVSAGLSVSPPSPTVAPREAVEFEAAGGSGEGYLWLFSVAESGGSIEPATGTYRAGDRGSSADVVYLVDSLGNQAIADVTVTAGLALTPGTVSIRPGEALTFTATGGSGVGHAWTLSTNGSAGTIDATTGAYVAGPSGGSTDVVQATDSLGNVGTATVTVTAPSVEPEGGCGCGGGEGGAASLLLAAVMLALVPRPRRQVSPSRI